MKRVAAVALFLAAARLSAQTCTATATRLCLNSGRFRTEVSWKDPQNNTGQGQANPLTPDTGYFWFFNSANVELVVKVLDARAVNGNFWVFFGSLSNVEYTLTVTDTMTGHVRTYVNPQGNFGSVGDTGAFPPGRAPRSRTARTVLDEPRVGIRVSGGMFELPGVRPESRSSRGVERTAGQWALPDGGDEPVSERLPLPPPVNWTDFQNNTGKGQAVPLTSDTGYFWFFNAANVELVAKVLDARAINGRFWVFYGALSNVQYDMVVEDTLNGDENVYSNPSGRFASTGDTTGLPPGATATAAVTAVGTPVGAAASDTIGPAGGQLQSSDGRLTLTIPAGALASPTSIGIQPVTNTAPASIWLGYRMTPDGQTFAKPVHLSFAYQDFDLVGSSADALRLSYQDAQGSWHTFKSSTIDTTARTISVDTTHFTVYNVSTVHFLLPKSATLGVNKGIDLEVKLCNFAPDPENPGAEMPSNCDSSTWDPVIQFTNWSVNGTRGGSTATGFATQTGGPNGQQGHYQAPGSVPSPNVVAVSVDLPARPQHPLTRYVSNIAILDCPIASVGTACPLAYVGTTKGTGNLEAGLVTFSFTASVNWSQRQIQSLGGTTIISYQPSGSLTMGKVTIGGCNVTLLPSTYQLQPLDGTLTIQFPGGTWGGGASTSNFSPSYTGTCSDGETLSGVLPGVPVVYFGDAVGGTLSLDYDTFGGTGHIEGETITYAFVNAFRAPPPAH